MLILLQHITFAILAYGRPSLALVAPAFLSCALFAYEVVRQARVYCLACTYTDLFVDLQQFVLLIQQVQAPEDLATPTPVPTTQAGPSPQSPSPPANVTNTSPTGVPLNGQSTTAASTSPQQRPRQGGSLLSVLRLIFQLVWYDERNRICAPALLVFPLLLITNGLVGYFVFIVLALVVRVMVAPGIAVILLAMLYSSIWAPQIVRATRRGRPCALERKYVIGTTIGRMLLAMCTHSRSGN